MARAPQRSLHQLFHDAPERAQAYCAHAGSLTLDYSRQAVDNATLDALVQLANAAALQPRLHALLNGDKLNNTEDRAAIHMQLRASNSMAAERRWEWADRIHRGDYRTARGEAITDVVNIGIGGSHLGPALLANALVHDAGPRCHFLSNVDPQGLQHLLPRLNPRTTLWIVSSKSLGTPETTLNAQAVCDWMDQKAGPDWRDDRLAAVTANSDAARALGIPDDHIFRIADSVGGRYSLWSAVDLPIAIAYGSDTLRALHQGARAMDAHALSTACRHNIPMLMALIGIWNRNFLHHDTLAIVPYDNQLALLPDYLQQLVMESNGKRTQRDGHAVPCHTSPIIWGGIGSNGQHSFHQCLHQGTDTVPVEFLIPARGEPQAQHDCLVANALAQAHTLAFGSASTLASAGSDDALRAHRHMPGNRPSSLLLYPRLSAEVLGALIAAYEHKTFFESQIWGINPFDQWGVELGKQISQAVYPALQGDSASLPVDLQASLHHIASLRKPS
jgi:glucose-6-phosphate isomerase